MARQSTAPVAFAQSNRVDSSQTMTSGRAGKVVPLGYIPVLRGDSASGRVNIMAQLAEMPRPLLNGVMCNVQAWFVPKTAFPQFSGSDEFMHSYQGEDIKALGSADRSPPPFFNKITDAPTIATAAASAFFKTLGIHIPVGAEINTDLVDSFWLIYNFRKSAHSSRLTRDPYMIEDAAAATTLPPAFWPSSRFSRVVSDYERALVLGSLDLDVNAGLMPIEGLRYGPKEARTGDSGVDTETGELVGPLPAYTGVGVFGRVQSVSPDVLETVYANLVGQTIGTTLADVDKARTTQAFAKLRTAYAGNDATGFDNDDAIVATLMQGFKVPQDQFKRPWLLDSKRVPVGFVERYATDAANLDASVTQGQVGVSLSVNLPAQDSGGYILYTIEILPERMYEAQTDEALHITEVSQLPDALRDIQRPEPVDLVLNRRLDARHATPDGLYGYEPMNDVWNRENIRMGGAFFQPDASNPFSEQRAAIWQAGIVDPTYTADHFLVPDDFPHDVFADVTADAFEVVASHNVTLRGITQIGDVLAENNDDYEAISTDDAE